MPKPGPTMPCRTNTNDGEEEKPIQGPQCQTEQPQMLEEKRGPESPRNRAPGEGEEEDINGPSRGGKGEKRKEIRRGEEGQNRPIPR
ncbi:hypothetical protein D5086_001441 [Populus alba]|uniref:Uncharacterized protein n=2 Tax=Populus TaxID=3689 RepID=A0ACC4CYR5_POPAL|nr:hypothetical protein NC653_001772 [Populus alba x Populus x berolinensis]